MRRLLVTALLVAAAVAVVLLVVPGGDRGREHTAVFDNAFGLTEGVDLKANGVRIGSVADLDVQRGTGRAVVTLAVERDDFGSLRRDVFCRIEPQSLIGEYFLNCEPGDDPRRLAEGATIPIEQTGTVVPPDLVQNVMRRPYRERLRILLAEFGAGFAARGEDLRLSIRRAVPALRETDAVLRRLAAERGQLRSLVEDSDTVLARLAGGRDDVARFVAEARDTARASANRRVELAQTIDRMPPFLRELRPTLADLATVARRQTPALRDLRAAAPPLTTLLERLGPFSAAARPAVRSLGEASVVGRQAAREAQSTVERVRRLGVLSREPITNLRFVLEHLDDRDFAVERSPIYGGRRLTGFEAFLQYPFAQSQAINLFDDRGYFLKIATIINECVGYTDAGRAEETPERTEECNTYLGPNQPGIDLEAVPETDAEPEAEAARAAESLADFLLAP
jgi:virulence factor Mce-like protein